MHPEILDLKFQLVPIANFPSLPPLVPPKHESHKQVKCLTCYRSVRVRLIPYGWGFVGICPVCGQLAYNSFESPNNMLGLCLFYSIIKLKIL